MVHPRYRVVRGETPVAKALTPVYPTTAGLAQDVLRRLIERALASADLDDTLPRDVLAPAAAAALRRSGAVSAQSAPERCRRKSCRSGGIPHGAASSSTSCSRSSFRCACTIRRRKTRGRAGAAACAELTRALLAALPFGSRARSGGRWREIERDLAQPHPMQRLLQGDVGSGKTIVAALAALQASRTAARSR